MITETRRNFIKKAAMSSVLVPSTVRSTAASIGANEQVIVGLIGGRNRGRDVALSCIKEGAAIKTFCDIDEEIQNKVGAELSEAQGKSPTYVQDFRSMLDDPEIDAVIVATPDHWHSIQTILACQAGKDVYVEKPLSQTIEEGQLMRDVARNEGRIVQVGTQRRSGEHFRSAIEYVASGRLGKLCLIKTWMCQVRKSIGNPPDGQVPAGVDYDLWLGPAPERPFNQNRFHYNWRFFWDYGNSELGNQGIHLLDIAMWGIQKLYGVNRSLPERISSTDGIYWLNDAKEVPDTQTVTYRYSDLMLVWELHSFQRHFPIAGRSSGTIFYGTEATLIVDHRGWEVHWKDGKVEPEVKATGGSHALDFLESVRSRKEPNADIEIGRLSTTLCHLGNMSHHLGRDLSFEPQTETFPRDAEANTLLKKDYRSPYLLPRG